MAGKRHLLQRASVGAPWSNPAPAGATQYAQQLLNAKALKLAGLLGKDTLDADALHVQLSDMLVEYNAQVRAAAANTHTHTRAHTRAHTHTHTHTCCAALVQAQGPHVRPLNPVMAHKRRRQQLQPRCRDATHRVQAHGATHLVLVPQTRPLLQLLHMRAQSASRPTPPMWPLSPPGIRAGEVQTGRGVHGE